MSKYEVGDKVMILNDTSFSKAPNGIYKKGEIHKISGIDYHGNPWFEGDQTGEGWANIFNWFEKITDEPTQKSYTLTPYIKPKTVTIDGIEYIMTENV